jgi:hypothetical protein
MSTTYPASGLDNFTLVPALTKLGDVIGARTHRQFHNDVADAVEALEAKLGLTASTPIANRFLGGTGTGTSAYRQVATADLVADTTATVSSVVGTTSSPTTTSGSAVDLAQMTISPTQAGVGYLWLVFECTVENTTVSAATTFTLLHNGVGAKSRGTVTAVANQRQQIIILHPVSTPSSGVITTKVQWQVSAGTATAIGIERSLTVIELKR